MTLFIAEMPNRSLQSACGRVAQRRVRQSFLVEERQSKVGGELY